jgi:GH15 family glucan-1,4-alpha-glucosidase
VPRFDAPSVFGTLLDRGAGTFRLGPFGINHPSGRSYEPGTNVLVTTWKTPTGWVEVRDALTLGPRRGVDTVTPHTRPPADDDAEHLLVRTVGCLDGSVEIELVCEPVFDYGRDAGRVGAGRRRPAHRRRDRRRADDPAAHRHGARHRGQPRARAARRCSGRALYCSLSWAEGWLAGRRRRRVARLAATTRFWRGWLAGARCPTTAGASRSSARRWRSRA